jgi:large subunit ribosomal protein L9
MKGLHKMKIVLLQDVRDLGKKDDIVNVADGYARNYLFPRNLAQEANKQNLNDIENRERAARHRVNEEKRRAEELAAKLEATTVRLFAKAGSTGKLFGSVTTKEVADTLSKQAGMTIDKHKIEIEGDIKTFGTYQCEVKLYPGISATLYILVAGEE